jgi:hypothetical protein
MDVNGDGDADTLLNTTTLEMERLVEYFYGGEHQEGSRTDKL